MIMINKILLKKWLNNNELCVVIRTNSSQIQKIKTELDNIIDIPIRSVIYSNNQNHIDESVILLRKVRSLSIKKKTTPKTTPKTTQNNIISNNVDNSASSAAKRPMDALVQSNISGARCGNQNVTLKCNRHNPDDEFKITTNPFHIKDAQQLLTKYKRH